MAIQLNKGARVDLSKEVSNLETIGVGLGWDENSTDTGYTYDLDVSMFMLNNNQKLPTEKHFIFYNNLISPDGSVKHDGDNPDGGGDGDDEKIFVNLKNVQTEINEMLFIVTIHEAEQKNQNFGQVRNSYIRIYNLKDNKEILKYELEEDFSTETAIEFGRLYKKDNSWRFQAVGQGYKSGLQSFVDKYL